MMSANVIPAATSDQEEHKRRSSDRGWWWKRSNQSLLLRGDGKGDRESASLLGCPLRSDQALSLAPSPPLRPNRIPLIGGSESAERTPLSSPSVTSQLDNTTKNTYDAPLEEDSKMLLQPEARPMSQAQLVNEVKGIYAGLAMVEKKCVEIDQQQSETTNKLSNEQWNELIEAHRKVLRDHDDFFSRSGRPTASPALRRLPTKKLPQQEIYGRTSVRTQLSLKLQGHSHTALADTGAQENVMSAALAKKLHLDVQTDHLTTHSFENAVGKRMKVAGHATVDCRFSDEPHKPISMKFWILEKVVVPLIVGRRFLEETSCLTRFRYLLQRMNVFRNLSPRILHMEVPRLRLQCRVGDQLILANPDTGSDLDLMSASYFQQSNFRLQKLEHSLQSVEFADGSTARLSGFVRVPFAMGSGEQPIQLRDFYVLDGLTTDILLGNATLEDFDAFNAYQEDFFELDEFDVRCDLHYIRWVWRSGSEEFLESPFEDFEFMVPSTVSDSETRYAQYLRYQDDREARRRSRTEEDIAKRPPSQRQTALDSEQQLQRSYTERRDAFIARYRAAVAAATGTAGP
nr:hypothetical protein LTR18_003165 [Exophiala xenobiotica]